MTGAPRIHGEFLKLGITISERTVSRYLRGRPPTRSQTWRTFFANYFGARTFISPVMFADARGDDVVVDASEVSFRPSQLSVSMGPASPRIGPSSIAVFRSNLRFLECVSGKITFSTAQPHAKSTGRDPPQIHGCNRAGVWPTGSLRVCL
jgi:hypothetical protein